ncbi:hypothetical protein PRIC1_015052 [Phytophthora ramorum]
MERCWTQGEIRPLVWVVSDPQSSIPDDKREWRMGNGQSRDEFAGVLPSAKASSSTQSDAASISEAWTAESSSSSAVEAAAQKSTADAVPLLVGKIVPPGHALQLEDNATSRLSSEASEVVRAFNKVERTDERFVIPESVRKSRTLDAFADVCSEILPGFLYVSNLRVARDAAKLRALGITHVINCCGELKHYEDGVEMPPASNGSEFNILKLLLRDDANEDLTPFLPQVMEYIASCRQRAQSPENGTGDKVLVHCHQGVSRSCAFAIAYVMLEQKLPYHEAAAMVKRQRAITSPNAAFICHLLEWEKDLQAMRTRETGDASFALGWLHRLAPHSKNDPGCLVLKRCFEPSAGSSRQRQHIASVRTLQDEQRLLWSQGAFVFQNPIATTELIVWVGAKCVIREAASTAAKLAAQLLHLQTLVQPSDEMKIIEIRESTDGHTGTDVDRFGYAAELQWRRDSAPTMPNVHLPANGDTSTVTNSSSIIEVHPASEVSASPQLFVLEAIGEQGGEDVWDQLTNYDSEDLTLDSAFLLCSIQSPGVVDGFVWLGTDCTFTPEKVVEAAQKRAQRLYDPPQGTATSSSAPLAIERQNEESDAFWELFEAGY